MAEVIDKGKGKMVLDKDKGKGIAEVAIAGGRKKGLALPLDKGKGMGKARGRKKGVAVPLKGWWGAPGRRSEEMNLDFARLKPTSLPRLGFGFLCFRTVRYDKASGSEDSCFYFLPIHHLLSATTLSRLFKLPEEFRKTKEPHIFLYESPVVPDSARSPLSCAAYRFPYLYIFGCGSDHTTDAFAFDLLDPMMGWLKLPPMSFPKLAPKAVCIDDHIYVFGTPHPWTPEDGDCFVDVFDNSNYSWTPIDPGHALLRVDPFLVPLKDLETNKDYILLHHYGRQELHLYGTSEESMALLPERSFLVKKQSAAMDGVLYCYKQHGETRSFDRAGLGDVVAYNLNGGDPKSWWTPIPVLGLSEHLSPFPVYDVHLLAIQEESILCVLFSWDSDLVSHARYVECYFFKMSSIRKPDEEEEATLLIKAQHLHTTRFPVRGLSCLLDCLFV